MKKFESKQKPKTLSKQIIKRKRVTFSFEATAAGEVILMGDFNNWNPKKHPMKQDKGERWSKTVVLSPGTHEYKFFVDGEWKEDPRNDQTCANCFGTQNSVLNIKER
ncbi:MAG: glycoside hydrolase [Deltaproteobacteria bacterium]|nr:glycoside hydrolase [Deltaproteobacteria bacterium]